MQRDAYRGSVGRKTRTRVERRPRLGEEENSEGNLRFHDKEVRKQIWALGKKHATEIGERKKILTAGKQNQGLRDRDEPKLTNLGKRMNSTNFTLWQDAARKTALRGLVLQRWRARKQIKGRGKNRRGLSKAGAADRECNVEHMQAAADSNGREKLMRLPGLGNREKKD